VRACIRGIYCGRKKFCLGGQLSSLQRETGSRPLVRNEGRHKTSASAGAGWVQVAQACDRGPVVGDGGGGGGGGGVAVAAWLSHCGGGTFRRRPHSAGSLAADTGLVLFVFLLGWWCWGPKLNLSPFFCVCLDGRTQRTQSNQEPLGQTAGAMALSGRSALLGRAQSVSQCCAASKALLPAGSGQKRQPDCCSWL
jgi:hypothetical protein